MDAIDLTFQSHEVLSIVQFRTDFRDSFDYISLSNAIKKNFVEVREISESGSVNALKVFNSSDSFVFMSDGDILSGAKQNRVLNTSVLIAPKSKTIIPVSCVEQGRWDYRSRKFDYSEYVAPSFMRASKAADVNMNLKKNKNYNADQRKVWDEVSDYETIHNVGSDSSNLSDIFFCKENDFTSFSSKFKAGKDKNGLAIFVNSNILNVEIFNRVEIYEEYFDKLLKGAYFDVHRMNKEKTLDEKEAFYKTQDFLDNIESMKFDEHKGVGVGIERRFQTDDITGFELSYENNIIHFVGMNLKKGF